MLPEKGLDMKQRWGYILVCLLLLAACGSQPARVPTATPPDGPAVETVKGFVAALEARDSNKLLNLMEPTDWRKGIAHELRTYMVFLEQVQVQNPSYTIESQSDSEAKIRLKGTLNVTLRESQPHTEEIDLILNVVNVNGAWYIRNVDLSEYMAPTGGTLPFSFPTFGAASVVMAQGATPNDPMYGDQWALDMIGAPCAWQTTSGSDQVTVAVVDSGVDMNHPDLAGRVRSDGHDFVDGDNDPRDENGHGTHVSGIIAATLNNAEGITGLAPGVKILPVRVMDAEGWGDDPTIAAGIRYAYQNGAKVINLSLGITVMSTSDTSPDISAAISEAQNAGALVVVASGNDFVPLPNGIASDNPDVLVVAASDSNDEPAPFSNTGPWVDVTAPGEDILATMPTYEVYITGDAVPADERYNQDYDYLSGTSMAAPYVSALAALVFSAHPDWTATQVQEAIKSSASRDIYTNLPAVYQRLGLLGAGRIDACGSLGGAPADGGIALPTPAAQQPTPVPDNPVVVDDQAPLEAAKAFMEALQQGNLGRANELVEGASTDNPAIDMSTYLDIVNELKQMQNQSYTLVSNNGEEATVQMTYTLPDGQETATFTVVKIDGTWYIRTIE